MADFEKLMPKFRKGTKIRQSKWDTGEYIYLLNGRIYDQKGIPFSFITQDLLEDWELYIEPKQKEIPKMEIKEAIKNINKLKRLLKMSKKYIKHYLEHYIDDDNYDRKPLDLLNDINKTLRELEK